MSVAHHIATSQPACLPFLSAGGLHVHHREVASSRLIEPGVTTSPPQHVRADGTRLARLAAGLTGPIDFFSSREGLKADSTLAWPVPCRAFVLFVVEIT